MQEKLISALQKLAAVVQTMTNIGIIADFLNSRLRIK